MVWTAPGQHNTFVQNHEATDGMIVTFSRDPAKFALAQYCQYKPVDKTTGLWMKINYEHNMRLVDSGMSDYWPDGSPRPLGNGELQEHEWVAYRTKRRAFPFNLGGLSVEQASWDIVAQHARMVAQRCMTRRTQQVATLVTNNANFLSTHQFASPAAIAGVTGSHDQSTVARSDIKKTLDKMADAVKLKTGSAVDPDQMMVVVSPEWARRVAACQEIREYLQQAENSSKWVEGSGLGATNRYGLPEQLYGYRIVVEDAVKITQRRGTTAAPEYIWPRETIVMLSRIGDLEAPEGPSFSSLTLFFKEEMTVESYEDTINRRHLGSVVEDYDVQLTSPDASVIVENCLSD